MLRRTPQVSVVSRLSSPPEGAPAPINPRLIEFVTWAVLRGARMFRRVQVTPTGLIATAPIPQYDFVVVVPARACITALNVLQDPVFPLKVSPSNFGNELPWWPDLSWGTFVLVALLTYHWITGAQRGLQSYLDILPFDPLMPIARLAEAGQRTEQYREAVAPLSSLCRTTDEAFDTALRHTYCLLRRHATPLWSAAAGGHPFFAACPLAQPRKGEILGMVPVLDLARHSATPNAAVGFPDAEMVQWLVQERNLGDSEADRQYIVLQALRDIAEGEVITSDKNTFYGFDRATFNAWFGFPYDIAENDALGGANPGERSLANATASDGSKTDGRSRPAEAHYQKDQPQGEVDAIGLDIIDIISNGAEDSAACTRVSASDSITESQAQAIKDLKTDLIRRQLIEKMDLMTDRGAADEDSSSLQAAAGPDAAAHDAAARDEASEKAAARLRVLAAVQGSDLKHETQKRL